MKYAAMINYTNRQVENKFLELRFNGFENSKQLRNTTAIIQKSQQTSYLNRAQSYDGVKIGFDEIN